jgi:hypothetical protein
MSLPSIVEPITKAEHHLVEKAPWAAQSIRLWDSAWTFDQKLIRAGFLRALLTGQVQTKDKSEFIKDLLSLHLVDALIVGSLNLDKSKNIPHLTMDDSVITGGITLRNAKTGCIHLSRCYILDHDIDAAGVSADGAVLLQDLKFAHRSILNFSQAKIDFGCTISNLSTYPAQATETLRKELEELVEKVTAPSPPAITIDPKFANLPNPRQLISDTLSAAASSPSAGQLGDLARLSLKGASIGGDLTIEGLHISTCNHPTSPHGRCNDSKNHAKEGKVAIDAERVDVRGDVILQSTDTQHFIMYGGITFAFAQIAGKFCITGVKIIRCASEQALNCEGTVIGGHLDFEPMAGNQAATPNEIFGGLRILGGHIKGQLILVGTILHSGGDESPEYDAAITGDGVIIDNDFFIRPTKDPECPSLFIGAVRLLGATIGGQLGIRGTCIIANPYKGPVPAVPAASPAPTRASLPAHFAALAPSVSWDQITEPAISMRDAIVKGGIFVRPMEAIPSYILGELRLNDAEINGVFSIRGCHLVAGKNGRAITADGIHIKGDLTIGQALANPLDPSEYPQCTMEGVIRLRGATIGEEFRISDATLDSRGQERAIIASRATVAGGLLIETSKPQDKSFRCEVLGELRFNHAHIGRRFSLAGILLKASRCRECLAIGAIGMQLAGDFEIDSCQIIGEIRVIGADIAGALKIQSGSLDALADTSNSTHSTGFAIDGYFANISRGVIICPCPAGGCVEAPAACSSPQLDTITVNGIVGFGYATLGSFSFGESPYLGSRWTCDSAPIAFLNGHIRLDGAKVKEVTLIAKACLLAPSAFAAQARALAKLIKETLKRWSPYDPRTVVSMQSADLGTLLTVRLSSDSKGYFDLSNARVVRLDDIEGDNWGWGSKPSNQDPIGVRLGLNGFSYLHLGEWRGAPPRSFLQLLLSPSAAPTVKRREWLQRQYLGGEPSKQSFTPPPYIQLASVYRSHGFNREADEISYDRRKYIAQYGGLNLVDRVLQLFYGVFFGFGYRSWAALLTCLFLFAVNGIFVCIGASHFTSNSAGESPRPWLAGPKHTGAVPSPLEFHFSFAPATILAASQSSAPTTQISQSTPTTATAPSPIGCRCRLRKHKPHPSAPPIVFPPQKGEGTGGLSPPKDAPPCACRGLNAALYTFDQTMPLVHVTSGSGCEIAQHAPWPYRTWHALMLFLSWIVIPTAGLTFSGILRETNK